MLLNHDITYSTTGNMPSVNFDPAIVPFNANLYCTLSNTGTYKLQYTLDTYDDPLMTDASANWIDSNDIPAGTTVSSGAAMPFPVTRARIVIAALSGTLRFQSQQGMSTN